MDENECSYFIFTELGTVGSLSGMKCVFVDYANPESLDLLVDLEDLHA